MAFHINCATEELPLGALPPARVSSQTTQDGTCILTVCDRPSCTTSVWQGETQARSERPKGQAFSFAKHASQEECALAVTQGLVPLDVTSPTVNK